MTANKHTPGPWQAVEGKTYSCEIVGKSPRGLRKVIARIGRSSEQIANARLIAAAPEYFDGTADLLAYEDAVEAGDDVQAMLLYASAVNKLRAAHLKATGGAA